jgi:hypothetical protein
MVPRDTSYGAGVDQTMQKITPSLWFNDGAEGAMPFQEEAD